MQKTWNLAIPAALALMVSACSGPATNEISPVANVGSAVGGNPGQPVSPSAPPAVIEGLTNTEAQSPPSLASRPTRRGRQAASRAPSVPTEQTTSGPSAAGRSPQSAQPAGNGGS